MSERWHVQYMGPQGTQPGGVQEDSSYWRWDVVGQRGRIIAVCPDPEIAAYLAALHNTRTDTP